MYVPMSVNFFYTMRDKMRVLTASFSLALAQKPGPLDEKKINYQYQKQHNNRVFIHR